MRFLIVVLVSSVAALVACQESKPARAPGLYRVACPGLEKVRVRLHADGRTTHRSDFARLITLPNTSDCIWEQSWTPTGRRGGGVAAATAERVDLSRDTQGNKYSRKWRPPRKVVKTSCRTRSLVRWPPSLIGLGMCKEREDYE
jgi:hypothetical protein